MDLTLVMKAGFTGFALSVGSLMLVFYIIGGVLRLSRRHFIRVFIAAGFASFVTVDVYLYYKLAMAGAQQPQVYLAGCVGGWLAGIFFGLTNLKGLLLKTLR